LSTHETPADVAATGSDPLAALDAEARSTLASIADHLIPAAHGMPSARDVVDDARLRFVLGTRPDLVEPLVAALPRPSGCTSWSNRSRPITRH
jgi:hypothetical protein